MVASDSPRVFQAIDLDRTLFDTRKLEELSRELVVRLHPEVAVKAAEESQRHIEEGTSFFIFRFLRSELTKKEYTQFIIALKNSAAPHDFLLEGAGERLAFAHSNESWSAGILTYGLPEDQYLKLELCGLDGVPFLTTHTANKGRVIASWQQPDGTFQLPPELGGRVVDVVTLEDDKPEAFVHLPMNTFGVLVGGHSVTLSKGIPDYTQPVAIVGTLQDSIAALNEFLH